MAQPALYIAGLAAAVLLQHREEQAAAAAGSTSAMPTPLLPRVAVTAGLSLGEYSALVWAGGMSFEDGLKVGYLACPLSSMPVHAGMDVCNIWYKLGASVMHALHTCKHNEALCVCFPCMSQSSFIIH